MLNGVSLRVSVGRLDCVSTSTDILGKHLHVEYVHGYLRSIDRGVQLQPDCCDARLIFLHLGSRVRTPRSRTLVRGIFYIPSV